MLPDPCSSAAAAAWFHKRYRHRKAVKALRKQFLSAKPFPHLALPAILERRQYGKVRKGLRRQVFVRRDAPLFSFSQTADLCTARDKAIQAFVRFLQSKELNQLLNAITGVKTKVGRVDALGFRYTVGDHLLCHNDRTPSRKIAYVIHFSSLKPGDGGALCLFSSGNGTPTRIVKRILPRENALVIFPISRKSHHMVEEVLTAKERLTIAGWFHA